MFLDFQEKVMKVDGKHQFISFKSKKRKPNPQRYLRNQKRTLYKFVQRRKNIEIKRRKENLNVTMRNNEKPGEMKNVNEFSTSSVGQVLLNRKVEKKINEYQILAWHKISAHASSLSIFYCPAHCFFVFSEF